MKETCFASFKSKILKKKGKYLKRKNFSLFLQLFFHILFKCQKALKKKKGKRNEKIKKNAEFSDDFRSANQLCRLHANGSRY